MESALITLRGIEDVAAKEVEELIKVKSKTYPSFLVFSVKEKEQLYSLTYRSQTARKIITLISVIEHKNEKYEVIIKKLLEKRNEERIKEIRDFKVTCVKEEYVSDTDSPDIATELGKQLLLLTDAKAELNDPKTHLIVFITKTHALFGIDLAGIDLAKREYKVFTGNFALKAPLAYALVRLANMDSKKKFLDPLCGAGIIPIEAALFVTKKSMHFFGKNKLAFYENSSTHALLEKLDKEEKPKADIWAIGDSFNHISWTKKNAKIAGVYDALQYSRTEVYYLDAKFEGNQFDAIVSYPPLLYKNSNEKKIKKLYHDLFDESNFLLKKKGRLVLLVKQEKEFLEEAQRVKLSLLEKRKVFQGQEELLILVFEK